MRARVVASVVLAAALLLGTSGCSFFAPQATLKQYDPSDGVGALVGNVKIRNALLLTKDGQEASLLVNLINDGQTPVDVNIQYVGSLGKLTSTFHLDAGETRTFGAKDSEKIVLQGIDTKPGALFSVFFQYGDKTGESVLVPVLDGTQSDYAGLLPSPSPYATPTPSPTSTVPVPLPSSTPSK